MNCKLRWILLVPAFITFSSCSSNDNEGVKDGPHQAAENAVEQPIEVVVKKNTGASEHAPIATAPIDTPAVIPPGPGPVAPAPVPVPVPTPVVVPEHCEDIFCGDSKKQDGEECDDGNDEEDDNCDNFCRKIRCGNGRVEGTEECDNPDHAGCTEDCTLSLCGNGNVDENETCDPPNAATECNANCKTSVCGNGVVEIGEECDDDNAVETDGCNSSCELACPVSPSVRTPN